MTQPTTQPTLSDLIDLRLNRRGLIRGAAALAAASPFSAMAQGAGPSSLTFKELAHTLDTHQHVAEGHDMQVVIRWGDPLVADAPAFDPANQTAAGQEKQFGYNNDYLGLYPLPYGSKSGDRFLLVVNHEYVNPRLMFATFDKPTPEQVAVEMAAVGGAVVEIAREGDAWKVVNSSLARRISANTPMEISGPAAGHARLKTHADPSGRKVFGTFANCAGGSTPWGTWLTCEENFQAFFGGDAAKLPDVALGKRYGLGRSAYGWERHVERFDMDKEPNEPNRFGWVVEIDPYEPQSVPVKRTALGRFAREGATYALARDGRVVFYSGDDARLEYVYKFVTARPWNPTDRERVLPTGTTELVINLGGSDRSFDAVMAGPHSRYFVLDTSQPTAVIGAHFKPGGAFAFLGLPGDELHNSHVPLDALWGSCVAVIRERLLAVADPDARLRLLERLLLARLDRDRPSHRAVGHALAAFRTGRRRIGEVVDKTGLSPRRFIRLFGDEVGLTPKAFCRIQRFQRTVSLLHGVTEVDWAETAVACGYYDQAHMIHDFQAFAGLNPTAYLARRGTYMNHVPQ